MSVYQSIVGRVIFEDEERFDAVKEKYSGWLTSDGRFASELGGHIVTASGKTDACRERLVIQFPYNEYRNMSPMFADEVEGAADYGFVWTCTDGGSQAGYKTPTETKILDLHEWAADNVDQPKPIEDDYRTTQRWFDSFIAWEDTVERKFAGTYAKHIPALSNLDRHQTELTEFE